MKAAEMRRLLPRAEAALAGHPDVTGVGLGEKVTGGETTGAYAIVVLVEEKSRPRGDPVPAELTLEGSAVPTDVRTAPDAAFRTANAALDGSDLLVASAVGRTGTLGLVLRADRGSGPRLYGLTNAHVVTVPDHDASGSPVDAEIGSTRRTIGRVAYQARYSTAGANTVDMAMIELSRQGAQIARAFQIQTFPGLSVTNSDSLSFSRFGGARRPHRYGGSTERSRDVVDCAHPVEHGRAALIDPSGARLAFGRCFSLTARLPGVHPGHSGALLVRLNERGGLLATGLVAGGKGPVCLAFSFGEVLRELSDAGFTVL